MNTANVVHLCVPKSSSAKMAAEKTTDADTHARAQEFRDKFRLTVGTQAAKPVPCFHHNDRARLERSVLGHRDELTEASFLAVFVLVARAATVREDFREGCEVVLLTEGVEHAASCRSAESPLFCLKSLKRL